MAYPAVIRNQIWFVFIYLSLEYSLTTIDFFFFERISYLAAIGVAGVMSFIYMFEQIITLFVQAMINNALYKDPKKQKRFIGALNIGLLFSIIVSFILVFILFFTKEYLVILLNISEEAREYTIQYVNHILLFFIIFNIFRYYNYLLNSLNMAKFNILLIIAVLVLNVFYNFISVYVLKLSVGGIALSTSLALITVIPLYVYILKKYSKEISLFRFRRVFTYYKIGMQGMKNLGFSAILGPVIFQLIQYSIIIIISYIGSEYMSSRYHARNFLSFSVGLAMAFSIMIQIHTSVLFGNKDYKLMKLFYVSSIKRAILYNFLVSFVAFVVIYYAVVYVSDNLLVQKYIIVFMVAGLLMEPLRTLSMVSGAHLIGMQQANIPLLLRTSIKVLIVYPLYYLAWKFQVLHIYTIILVEMLMYLMNFIVYNILINNNYKKLGIGKLSYINIR